MEKKSSKSRRSASDGRTDSQRGALISSAEIETQIYLIRGHRVMLSSDLALLYEVEPKVLVQAVKRNIGRFPDDFMFQLTKREVTNLKSQIVTLNPAWLRRAAPYAFTEQGVAMLSGVLNSPRAVRVNIEIMRAFVRLRSLIRSHADLSRRLDELEKRYDSQFKMVFDAIRRLMQQPEVKRRKIGFELTGRSTDND
jgi:hypothetical protein